MIIFELSLVNFLLVSHSISSALFLNVGFVDFGVGVVTFLSVHIEEEIVLGIGRRCDVNVSTAVVDMHDVVDNIGAIGIGV